MFINCVGLCSTSGQFAMMEFIVDMRTSGTMTPRMAVSFRPFVSHLLNVFEGDTFSLCHTSLLNIGVQM
jgi:hypothetical protein